MSKRTWTIVADGNIVRRLIGTKERDRNGNPTGAWLIPPEVEGLNARLIANAGCFIFQAELKEYDAERLKPDPDTGRLKWNKVKRTRWERSGDDRCFMPAYAKAGRVMDTDTRDPGFWPKAAQEAGDSLVAYLKAHPRP